MSDLQCAARVVMLDLPALDGAVELLRERRPAALYLDGAGSAGPEPADLALKLGLQVRRMDGLAAPTYRGAVAELADLHRGETVVAVVTGAVLDDLGVEAAPSGAANRVVEVAVDADGWALTFPVPRNAAD